MVGTSYTLTKHHISDDLNPLISRTMSLNHHMKVVHTCKTRCTLTIEPIDGVHTRARVATRVRMTFIDVIITVLTSPAWITLTVVAITLCQDKHVWQWHKTQVTSRHKYMTHPTDPLLYDKTKFWTCDVQATVEEVHLHIPWSRILLEVLVKELSTFNGNQQLTTIITYKKNKSVYINWTWCKPNYSALLRVSALQGHILGGW